MFKLIFVTALIALAQAYPGLLTEELVLGTVGHNIHAVPSAYSSHSQTVVHGRTNVVSDLAAPAVPVETTISAVSVNSVSENVAGHPVVDVPSEAEVKANSNFESTESASAPQEPLTKTAEVKSVENAVETSTPKAEQENSEAANVKSSENGDDTASVVSAESANASAPTAAEVPVASLPSAVVAPTVVSSPVFTPAAVVAVPPSEISFHGTPLLKSLAAASTTLHAYVETPIAVVH
ncbi:uncharacterized protein LOC101890251 [Musca domestica]|uniref:Uncharacterized protein LOC101890251 n=1 Tax=Musca domestica TaxID=7370 RepID=A0A1I8MQH4_MUSDO|nr:uncharacterized protein LOC101890251 [Musca domestica]